MVRLSILLRLIWPSTGLVVQGSTNAALMASKSRRRLTAKLANSVPAAAANTSSRLSMALQQLVQAFRPGDSDAQRRFSVEQLRDEYLLLGVQPRSARHQEPGQAIAARYRPDRRERPAQSVLLERIRTTVPGCPIAKQGGVATKAERHELAPELGSIATSVAPAAAQEGLERIKNAVARRLLP